MNVLEQIHESVSYIRSQTSVQPKIGLILGSGLGSLADEITGGVVIPYTQIPFFPVSHVEGHSNQLVIGMLEGKTVVAMQGRFHFYEGYTMQQVTFPVRVMKELGVQTLIVTNASGGINPQLYPGALMLIRDHINFMGTNPLIGENFEELGPRFPDMSSAYNKELIALAKTTAQNLNIEVKEGVHAGVTGPYYFSPAELKMIRSLGADSIGMSTIPEVIVAAHAKLNTLGICCITDMAIPENLEPLDHEKVMAQANEAKPRFIRFVKGIIHSLSIS